MPAGRAWALVYTILMPARFAGPRGLITLFLCALVLVGCAGNRDQRRLARYSPDALAKQGESALRSQDFGQAVQIYEAMAARYPFAPQSRQARLNIIYAYYRLGEKESARDAADTFIRENPTHPRIDYAWYLKGLTDFERLPNFLERWFSVDLNKRPPTEARRSFAAFATVVDQYPNSDYAHDARRRMVYLRNRLADYEIAVARYYVGRGAYVAAAQRSKVAIEEFDGAPAVKEALEIMAFCYDKMELKELSAQTRAMYRQNFEGELGAKKAAPKRKWYKLWLAS